jgi:negative regulator of flagellin synthesis FlgM
VGGERMRIDKFGFHQSNPYASQKNQIKHVSPMKSAEDKIEISSTAKEMSGVSKVIQERQERISKLKQQIESGTYKVDSKIVAKSMVDFYQVMKKSNNQ